MAHVFKFELCSRHLKLLQNLAVQFQTSCNACNDLLMVILYLMCNCLQVNYEGDPQAALIQFSSNSEARRAYSSPEAVLGNRFIKLFWHNKTKELPPMVRQTCVVN